MRLVKALVLLAGVVHAGPALQHPLSLGPCTYGATPANCADEPTPTSEEPPSTSEEPPCSTPSLTSVTFNELAVTYYGEEVYLIGGIKDLGDWNPDSALHLDSSEYTEDNPLWFVTVDLPVDAAFEYKYIRKESDGSIVWESDPNRSYTVEGNCDGNATENDSWR